MRLARFQIERYFARYEFAARHLLGSSDCEGLSLSELLAGADDECRELWEGLRLGYTESRGLPELRREIAGLYSGVEVQDVLEVVPEEGILLAMATLLEPGDHVIATHPGYQSLHGIAEMLGCEISYWQPDEERGWRFDPAFVREQLRPTTRLIVVNFPHNPTGALLAREEFAEVVDLAAAAGIHLFSDEMYRWLESDPATMLPTAVELYEKAVTLCGLSKTFSLPGLRVGWLATRDGDVAERLAAAKDYTTICGSAPSEVLALMGLRGRETIVGRNRETIAVNLRLLQDFVAAHADVFSLVPPRAGSICFARLHAAEGADAFCRHLVEEAGVCLVPSSAFGYGDAHVRFGLGRAGFADGLAALADWLRCR